MHDVVFTPHALQQLEVLDKPLQLKIIDIVTEYAATSRTPGERFRLDPKMYSDVINDLEIIYRKEKSRIIIALIRKTDK